MKKLAIVITAIAVLASIPLLAEEVKLGKPVTVKEVTLIKDILGSPDKYLGKDIRIEGEIAAVCQNMGCWINVKDTSTKETIQVKVDDGVIVFPKDGAGKKVVAQGKLEKVMVSKEELINQAKESGKEVDPSKITGGKMTYRIKGDGAIIQ